MQKEAENLLRTVRFEKPDYIPMDFHINGACWNHYPQGTLQDLMADHKFLFPDFKRSTDKITPSFPPWERANIPYTDPWRCTWQTNEDGIVGVVTEHPLESWDNFADFTPPDPAENPEFWLDNRNPVKGRLKSGGLRHGHTFLTLTNLRGYENLMFDMADAEPKLFELIRMVEDCNLSVIQRYIDEGAQWISYPEDLGMQAGPMISPQHFRKYIKPSYQRMMKPARQAGCIVHMHSDGDIRQLVDDLIDGGVEVINLQDLVNGIDWIAEKFAGKTCVELDIDRQKVTVFGTPADIDLLIREEVEKISTKQGGLMMVYGLYPGVPMKNVKAVMDAMEKYATYY